jgi:predicted  nucleic acid-binding Zn-ribbon protein
LKFIEKIFGKKEEAPSKLTLKFNELAVWLEKEGESTFAGLGAHIGHKYNEISTALEDLSEAKERLVNASFGEKVYKRLAKAGASNRDNLVKNLDIIIEKIAIPEDADPSEAYQFNLDAKSVLKTCLENAVRSQQYVKALFPEEYKDIWGGLKHLDVLLDELVAPINEVKDELEAYDKLPRDIEQIRQMQQQIPAGQKNINELTGKYETLKVELGSEEARLEEVEAGDEFTHARELEGQARTLKGQVSEVDSNLAGLFAPLSKALSRMEKQDGSARHIMSADSRKVLKILKDEPVSALDIDLTGFLVEMKTRVEDGSLGLKQQKMNKTLEQIDRLVGTDVLSRLKSQREEYSSELAGVRGELEGLTVYREKTQVEDRISECRNVMDSTGQKLDAEKKEVARLKKEVEELKSGLDSDLSDIFGKDIEVRY